MSAVPAASPSPSSPSGTGPPPGPARALPLLVCGLFGLLLGVVLTVLGVGTVASEVSLRSSSSIVEARITGARITQIRQSGRSYELTYRFQVPGKSASYDHRDGTGRTNLWASVEDEETWRAAKARGTVSVRYLPSDPFVNRPVKSGASPLGDPIAGLVIGLFIAIPSLLLCIVQIRGLRRRTSP